MTTYPPHAHSLPQEVRRTLRVSDQRTWCMVQIRGLTFGYHVTILESRPMCKAARVNTMPQMCASWLAALLGHLCIIWGWILIPDCFPPYQLPLAASFRGNGGEVAWNAAWRQKTTVVVQAT